jgi:Integrase core domain
MEGIASIDLFVVPTIAFQQLFAFLLVLSHERRRLLWFAVTRNPTAEWLARQITEAFPWDSAPKYLVRDNDRAFGVAFRARVRAMGIRDRPTSFRSPWQNGYAERLIGSIRRECTDHLIVFNGEHLRRILVKYATYYNEIRTHVSLGKDAPCTRAIERFGDIVAHPILGGATPSICTNLTFRKRHPDHDWPAHINPHQVEQRHHGEDYPSHNREHFLIHERSSHVFIQVALKGRRRLDGHH